MIKSSFSFVCNPTSIQLPYFLISAKLPNNQAN